MITVKITLTTAGADSGPFNLFSNVDGFTFPFESNVNKSALQSGYTSALVPDGTITIRVASVGKCVNTTDIDLQTTTTTSTTRAIILCSATVTSGGAGKTEFLIPLDPAGGVIIFQFDARTYPDKLEILHNGVKKSTTSMTVPPAVTNSGPFDNIYGDPTLPPSVASVAGIPQFIGAAKTPPAIPNRKAEFDAANPGLGYITTSGSFQQLIWWKYTSADYAISPNAILRAVGPIDVNTLWDIQRLCPTTTTSSSTSSTSTTTSSTSTTTSSTTAAPTYTYIMTPPNPDCSTGCNNPSFPNTVYSKSSNLVVGSKVYTDSALTIPVAGGGNFYRLEQTGVVPTIVGTTTGQIDGSGAIYQICLCT